MVTKLTKHDDGYALIIDESMLEALRITLDSELELSTDGRILTISPVKNNSNDELVDEAIERINRDYPNALKKLAE